MNVSAFKDWIGEAEDTPTVDLKQAKAKWANKRKQLLKLSKLGLQLALCKTLAKSPGTLHLSISNR